MKRIDEALLHGPWEDGQGPEDVELAELHHDFGHQWRIWRSISDKRVPGDWHAVMKDPIGTSRSERSSTALGLRQYLAEADPER